MLTPESAGDQKALKRLEVIRRQNAERGWINRDLYRLLYKSDLYVTAYERIKSAPGNMTPGTDSETLDGFSMDEIERIILEMRTETYKCKPVRTAYIPKANGKLRKLGIPSTRDKIVQEVIRLILEAIYDSQYGSYFSGQSHGFRRARSSHSALKVVQREWSGVTWIVEGDIKACFDEIDHNILIDIIREKIKDERFIALIRKILKAGYQDLNEVRKDSLAGTPQGGIVSPILANIYLDKLDQFVEQLQVELEKGKKRKHNLEYKRLQDRRLTLIRQGKTKTEEFEKISVRMKQLPSMDTKDPDFIRVKYVRYADDWMIGVIGSKELAEEIKERVKVFLKSKLNLRLSEEKTAITNTRTEEAKFLGYRVRLGNVDSQKQGVATNGSGKVFKKRTTGMQVVLKAPMDELIKKLNQKGFCDKQGMPIHRAPWTLLDEDQIVNLYSSINRGILQYYRPVDNWARLQRVQYILKFSLAKTLAAKRKTAITSVIYGNDVRIITKRNGKEKPITFYQNGDWAKNRDAFMDNPTIGLVRMNARLRTRSKLGLPCCICGDPIDVQMHHVRHVRKMTERQVQGFTRVMAMLNRKQIPVCARCHRLIHGGQYDNLSLRDLAYDPRTATYARPTKPEAKDEKGKPSSDGSLTPPNEEVRLEV